MSQRVRIYHRPSRTLLAEGRLGWDITPFEGNFYVRRKNLRQGRFQHGFVPGLCPYKGLYVWLDLLLPDRTRSHDLAWMYWLPNPLLPFIWYRVALPGSHPELEVEILAEPAPHRTERRAAPARRA